MTLIHIDADQEPVRWCDLQPLQLDYDTTTPEQLLLSATLKLALVDYYFGRMTWRRSARQWFHDYGDEPWSFAWVCRHLNLDPEQSRYTLLHFNISTIKKIRVLLV